MSLRAELWLTRLFWLLLVLDAASLLGGEPLVLGSVVWTTAVPLLLAAALVTHEVARWRELAARLDELRLPLFTGVRPVSPGALLDALSPGLGAGREGELVVVEGRVRARELVTAPLTGERCAAYRVTLELVRPRDVRRGALRSRMLPRLADRSAYAELCLESADASVRIDDAAVLHLSDERIELMPWAALNKNDALRELADAQLAVLGEARAGYSGVQVIETTLPEGVTACAYGASRRTAHAVEVVPAPGLPASRGFVVSTLSPAERAARVARLGAHVRGATLGRAALALLLVAIAAYARLNPFEVGRIAYASPVATHRVELRPSVGSSDLASWTTDRVAFGDGPVELQSGDVPAVASATSEVTVVAIDRPMAGSFVVGRHPAVRWLGEAWGLDLGDKATATSEPEERRGALHLRNNSDQALRLSFVARPGEGAPKADDYWDFAAREGSESEQGPRLTGAGEAPIELATGDLVVLKTASKSEAGDEFAPVRSFYLGYAPEARYVLGVGWVLPIEERDLRPDRTGLRVRNLADDRFIVQVHNAEGARVGEWTFAAKEGSDSPAGQKLSSGDATLIVEPGFSVRVQREIDRQVWRGVLAACPFARFERLSGKWMLALDEAETWRRGVRPKPR